jgi:nucleoside-diphosphate-sugar epimerase
VSGDAPVIVTGAAGFIGRRVVARLESLGRPVHLIEHRWTDAAQLRAAPVPEGAAACVHLGWYASPSDYLTSGQNLESLERSLELVALLGERDCRRLVVAGTCAEYGVVDGDLGEESPLRPCSLYGATKVALDAVLESELSPPGLEVCWARLFNLIGPGEDQLRLVPTVIRSLLAGEPVGLSAGTQQRDFLDVDDVASALVHLTTGPVERHVNICSGEAVSLHDLLSSIGERLGGADLLRFGARPTDPNDPRRVVGRPGRLIATGWARTHDLDQTIDRAIAYWRRQHHDLMEHSS